MKNKIKNSFLASIFVASTILIITGCSSPIMPMVGGNCHFEDVKEIAKIAVIANDKVILFTEQNQQVVIDKSPFTIDKSLVAGNFYQLNIRKHTGGGCSPYSVISAEKLTIKGIELSPSDSKIYASDFALSKQQVLTKATTSLHDIDASSGHSCSAAEVRQVLAPLENKPHSDEVLVLVCFSKLNNNETTAVLFSQSSPTTVIHVFERTL